MPYIKQDRREALDNSIDQLCLSITSLITDRPFLKEQTSNEDFLSIGGDINYCFSRIVAKLMGEPSYSKVLIATGVLENIKQEFYRRVAEPYENKKIIENGDVEEYKNV